MSKIDKYNAPQGYVAVEPEQFADGAGSCADIPAQGVAESLINSWNNYQEEQQCGN